MNQLLNSPKQSQGANQKIKMKKIIALILFVATIGLVTQSANAQTALKSRYNVALDTVTNTGSKNMTSARVSGAQQTVTVSTINTNLTGTLAGIARLWGSLDGVSYDRVRSTQLQGGQVDSLLIDANHPVKHWVVLNSPYQYYQVRTTGVGTTTFTIKGATVAH